MKHFYSFMVMLFAFTTYTAQNLVLNPGFETGTASSWTGATPTIVTSDPHSGTYAAEFLNSTSTQNFNQDIAITGGDNYTVSFWYKAVGDGTDVRIWSNFKDGSNANVFLDANAANDPLRSNNGYLASSPTWVQHSVTFTAPANAVLFHLEVRNYNGSTANYDDFSLINNGSSTTPSIVATPASLDLGNITTGANSGPVSLTVNAANLTVAPTYAISGADASMFATTGTLTVSGGSLDVSFAPTSIGAKTATLTITSGATSTTVPLSGNGVSAGNPYGLDDSAPLNILMEDFESGTANTTTQPSGWTNIAETGNRTWDTKDFGGNKYTQISAFSGTGTYKVLLISPAVNLDNINKANVTFDWNSGYSNGATLDIYIIKLSGGVMQKTLLQTINDNVNTGGYGAAFTTVPLNLAAYSGNAFLAFEYNGVAGTTTTTYQIDNVNMPTSLAVVDFENIKNQFVKNTMVTDVINFNTKADVKIFSMNGQVVKSASVSENKNLEVADLAPGMYIVTGMIDGQAVSTKIVKK